MNKASFVDSKKINPSRGRDAGRPAASSTPARPTTPTSGAGTRRTGIEVWSGRPGIPKPQPPRAWVARTQPGGQAPRTGTGGPGRKPYGAPTRAGRSPSFDARNARGAQPIAAPMAAHKKVVRIEAQVSLQTLAARMGVKTTEVLLKLLALGAPGVHVNSVIDADTAKILAGEFGWTVEDVAFDEAQAIEAARAVDDVAAAPSAPRAPVVTVMGHVDHGKTSLLDRIRHANVAAGEAGGITQHIGAYRVPTRRGAITFLDTPGHEAFTQMRARGARVTDVVVLVVAADEGVMPQTKEAVSHAKDAGVPVVVAVNKIDKPGADLERVMRELAPLGLAPEAWGGTTLYCPVSAKSGEGIEQLLEALALQTEVLELRASPERPASGAVIEALLDKGKGPVARVLVTDGTLRAGDVVLAGAAWGKIRAMTDEAGRPAREAGPSTPVEILGLSDVPHAGDAIVVVKDAKRAQEIADERREKARAHKAPALAGASLEGLAKRLAEGDRHELHVVLKADVQGSVEALAGALTRLSTDKLRVSITHAGVGAITEGDVHLAAAAGAIVVGFNARATGKAARLAEAEGVEIRHYEVIYAAADDVKRAMAGLLAPTIVEKALGAAEVRKTFASSSVGTIAGCLVTEGVIRRSARARILRGADKIWEGRIAGLRRVKDDVSQVDRGLECGVVLDGFGSVEAGDVIACFETQEIAATL